MINRKKLSTAVHSALVLGSGALMASVAIAQETPKSLDTVLVTGSRIKRVDTETASPVFSINKETIEKTGAVTIGEFLQDIPSIAGAATNPQVNNGGGDGAATVSLRGLGDERTLILINGRRFVSNDVNSIPMSMVQSIEVLKDGASAIYGSDAIGGVVNFILKSNFEGLEASVNYGLSEANDGQRTGVGFTWGTSGERGNLIISANYNKQEEVRASARDFAYYALSLYSGVASQGGSSRIPNGRYVVSEATTGIDYNNDGDKTDNVAVTRKDGFAGTSKNDFRAYNGGTDAFNYQAVGNVLTTPQERVGMFISGNFDITDSVTAYVDIMTNNTRSAGQIAPLPFDGRPANDNIVLSKYSQFNPFGQDILDSRLRLSRIGNRRFEFTTDVSQFTGGLKGDIGDTSWSWDVNAIFGSIDQSSTSTGYLFSSAMTAALGPSKNGVCYTDGTFTTAITGCTPIDFFGAPPVAGTPSGDAALAALTKISPSSTNKATTSLRGYSANFNGDLFEMSGGTVQAAFGFERRENSYAFEPSFLAVLDTSTYTCQISSEACTLPVSGKLSVNEFYGELYIPIVDSFNVSLGSRYSDYSTFGSTVNSKIGLEWRPFDELLLRGTYAQVFRAPTITDLYSGRTASSDGFADPCNGIKQLLNPGLPFNAVTNPYVNSSNPACAGVLANGGFQQSDTQLSAFRGGNASLTPEEGTVTTFGIVYEPSWLDGFSTTIDFWKVELENVIGTVGTQNILNLCYASTLANPSPLCGQFSRDPATGEMVRLFDDNQNVGVWDTQGVDIGFKYRIDTDFGKFRASLDTTYLDQFDTQLVFNGVLLNEQSLAGSFLSPANGGLGNYSQWRGLANLGWSQDIFDVSWSMRYVGKFQVGNEDPTLGTQTCADLVGYGNGFPCAFDVGSVTYHNIQAGVSLNKMVVRIGVDNLFDKQPPILYQNNTLNGNIDERTFDSTGRYFWGSVTVNF